MRRWLVEKKAKAEAERARRLAGRADAKLKGVVISEKWDKKWQKYTTPNLPFPYSQKEVRSCPFLVGCSFAEVELDGVSSMIAPQLT